MIRIGTIAVLAAVLAGPAPARADDVAASFLYVGLPIMDSVVFVGGIAAAIGGTAAVVDNQPSPGWRGLNYAFGGLNVASVAGYAVAMGVTGLWPFLLWPCLAHVGLAIGNFVIAGKLGGLDLGRGRVALVPLAGVDRRAVFGGVALRVARF